MLPHNERNVCYGCGRVGTSRRACPDCPCSYCHRNGHSLIKCPAVPPCGNCGKKGHRTNKCMMVKETVLEQEERLRRVAALKKSKKQLKQTIRFNISVTPPPHDEQKWLDIPQDVRESLVVEKPFIFPSLEATCTNLLHDIINGQVPDWDNASYTQDILLHGGVDAVTSHLLGFVRPEILDLQGQEVTTKNLNEIKQKQDKDGDWVGAMGYLDYITDTGNPEYNRRYVGQCRDAERRIMSQHIQEIMRGSTSSLHYFSVWIGNGKRSANFIRLWELPESTPGEAEHSGEDNWTNIRMNLLEALFCKEFRSHHGVLDRQVPGQLVGVKSFGLNIMTPLAQNSVKLDAKRIRYVQDAGNSPDPQILFWVTDFRASRARKKKIQKDKQLHATREIFRVDFDRALESALGDPVAFQNMKDSMTAENIIPDCHTDSEHLFTPFFGTLAAKIGFVLDYAAVSPASDSFSGHGLTESRSRIQLPWALKGCQFDETNVLIWTFNFQAFSPLDQNNISDSCNDDVSHYHQELLDSSNARIVFLCGPRATNALRLVHKKRYFLELRGFHYTVYLSRTPFSTGPQYRLFICCPALPAQIWSTRRCEGAQIGEALRFAISMLSLDGIRPYSVETVMVVGTILSWARAHRMGKPSVTVETINFHVALWLTRKGIPLDRLKRIVEIAGNLPRALLMILYCLNAELPETHQPSKKRFPDQAEEYHLQLTSSKKVRCYEPFDMGACSKIHALVREGIKDENEKYVERLKSLGVDLSVGHSSGQSSVQSPVQSSPSSEDATDLLIGKELPSPETLTTVKSVILRSHNNQLTKKERALDKKLDVDITDAMRLGSEAVDLGILDPSISRPKRQNRPKIRGRIWERQVDVFRQSEYSYRVDPAGSRKISVKYCPIVFPAGEDIGNGEVYVKIVINPPGKAHPQCYATRATDVDPASRMAFQLRFQPFKGPEVKRYATHDALTSIYRANTLVDILLGIPIEDIARKPRRYIYFWGESRIPAGLERFMGGSYTEGTILDV